MRNCPNCGKRLVKGETAKDGEAEVTELLCKRCGGRFADIKLPLPKPHSPS